MKQTNERLKKAAMDVEKKIPSTTCIKELAVALISLILAVVIFFLYANYQKKERELLKMNNTETIDGHD